MSCWALLQFCNWQRKTLAAPQMLDVTGRIPSERLNARKFETEKTCDTACHPSHLQAEKLFFIIEKVIALARHACVGICTHVHMYVCMYACMHVCMHACMHVCMYVYIHTYIHTYIHSFMQACMQSVIIYIHIYIYIGVHVYVYVCNIYIYTCICARTHTYKLGPARALQCRRWASSSSLRRCVRCLS